MTSVRFALVPPLLAAALLAPFPAAEAFALQAQEVSDVSQLDPATRSIKLNAAAVGSLGESDAMLPDATYAQAWALEGLAGSRVTVDLQSEDFDSFLRVVGPGFDTALRDDDSGDVCDARITVEFPATGRYLVVVGTVLEEQTGSFTLRVSDQPRPVSAEPCVAPGKDVGPVTDEVTLLRQLENVPVGARSLAVGSNVQALLTFNDDQFAGSRVQAWALQGSAESYVTVDLASDELDFFEIRIVGPGVTDFVVSEDAGACTQRLTFQFPETGTYRVIVAGGDWPGNMDGGHYALRAGERPAPHPERPCFQSVRTEVPWVDELLSLPVDGRTLEIGGEARDELTDHDWLLQTLAYGRAWALEGEAGSAVTVDLISEEFDAYLAVVGPGIERPRTDDDGGGACNARITLVLPETGTYRVVASTLLEGIAGRFLLRATRSPGPLAEGECEL